MSRTKGSMTELFVSVTDEMLERIKAEKLEMSKRVPGCNVTLADAARQVLHRGLENKDDDE